MTVATSAGPTSAGPTSTGPSVEIVDLTMFLAVARNGSFGRAAVELQLAQPSVSARMAHLERKYGVRLFDRTHRGTALTPAGERLAGYARRCVNLLGEAAAAVRAEGFDRLVVAAPASLGSAVFPAVLDATAGRPLDVVCRVAHSDEAVAALLDGSAHAGFVLHRVLPPGLASVVVATSPIVTVVGAGHPAAALDHARPDTLIPYPVVVHNWSEQARQVHETFASAQRALDNPVRLVGTPDVAVELAITSGYVAVIPRFAAVAGLRRGDLRLVELPEPGVDVQIRLVHRTEAQHRPGIEVLRTAVGTIAARLTGGVDAEAVGPDDDTR